MNKLLKKAQGMGPVTDIYRVLAQGDAEDANALELVVMLKRAETALTQLRKDLQLEANTIFTELQKQDTDKASWEVQGARITKYTPRSYWTYPIELVKLENELKAKQEQAKKDKTAKKHIPPLDPVTSALFAITL